MCYRTGRLGPRRRDRPSAASLTVAGARLVIYMFGLYVPPPEAHAFRASSTRATRERRSVAVLALGAATRPPPSRRVVLLAVVLVRFAQAGAFTSIFIMINNWWPRSSAAASRASRWRAPRSCARAAR